MYHPTRLVSGLIVWAFAVAAWYSTEPAGAQERVGDWSLLKRNADRDAESTPGRRFFTSSHNLPSPFARGGTEKDASEFRPLWVRELGGESARFPQWLSVSEPQQMSASHQDAAESVAPLATKIRPVRQPRVDGTWSEEDGYVIINLNGQELRLAKSRESRKPRSGATATPRSEARPVDVSLAGFSTDEPALEKRVGGTVYGRLMNRRRPLYNCKVRLISLQRSWGGYSVDRRGEPQLAETNESGEYRFDNVPRGPYKLYWLPPGQRSWIRRLKYRPDVFVRTGETSRVKEIRTALRTIN